ncbi:unnamed protein product [Closterium sp. Naga37s-1]|nr:unnamed protein product [Closterium sp. Naga37s-1]
MALLVGASICAAFTELQEVLPAAWLQLLMLRFFSAARVGDRPWRNLITLTVLVVATQACGTTVAYASMYAMDPTANVLASSQIAVANVLPCLADSLFRFTYRLSPHLHPLVFPLVSASIWTHLSLLSPFGALAHPFYSLCSLLPLVQATAYVGMDGVLLLVAWLVGGIHQMMCEGDAVGRGEEGWRRGEWGESRGESGRVVGEEGGGRGEGHVRCPGEGVREGGSSQVCGEGCNSVSAMRNGAGGGGGVGGVGGGEGVGAGGERGEGAVGRSNRLGGGSSGWGHVQMSVALLVVLMAAGFFQKPLEATIVPSVPVSCILSQAPANNISPRPPPSLCQRTAANASTHLPTPSMLLGADGGEGENGGGQGECRQGVAEGEASAAGVGKGETGRAKAAAGEAAESTTAASVAAAAAREAWEKWEAWRVAGIARMVQQTQQRARAGDVLILWSEAPVILMDDHEEATLLADLAAIATAASTSRAAAAATSTAAAAATAVGDDATPSTLGPYLGASYVKLIGPNFVINTFALIGPSGAPILRYNKSHLFPSVEANVQPGLGSLPVVDTPLGRLSVAVCFDMQFPALIRQAGRQGVDILLQPSWTWGAIGHVTFETDAVRAAENGLTLLRCSSIGVSGVVSPYYRTLAAQEALESGMLTMHLPLQRRAPALYPFIGLPISLLLLFVTLFAAFLAISPPYLSLPFCRYLPTPLCSLLPYPLCLGGQQEGREREKKE